MQPPAEKLPLATRKELRDNWESKKDEYEKDLSETLGVPWSFTFNPNLIYANCEQKNLQDRLGSVVGAYFSSFNKNAKEWIKQYGDDGKAQLNSICSEHVVEIYPQETTQSTYGDIEVKEGLLRIVYPTVNFYVNVDSASSPEIITQALSSAEKKVELGLKSRRSIRDEWEKNAESLRESIGKIVAIPDIKLDPNFEENAEKIGKLIETSDNYQTKKSMTDYLDGIGGFSEKYFTAMKKSLVEQKIGEDDMVQEAFQEAVSSKTIGLRIVEKLETGTWNETVIKDGVMWMQCTVGEWCTNIDSIASDIMGLL